MVLGEHVHQRGHGRQGRREGLTNHALLGVTTLCRGGAEADFGTGPVVETFGCEREFICWISRINITIIKRAIRYRVIFTAVTISIDFHVKKISRSIVRNCNGAD